jgi:hypothetical protein
LDQSETLAKEYLCHLGFEDIIYEPDGNIPPDFLVNKRIAVEVRQLNQNEITDSEYRGLEELAIPLSMRVRKLLASLGPADSGDSWFVCYTFKRPFLPWDQLQAVLRKELKAFRETRPAQSRTKIRINDHFQLDLIRATDAHPSLYVFGGYSDHDSGGWVLSETQKNLRICIKEKTQKIARFRKKYQEWWLILIDLIGYGVEDCDRTLFREHLAIDHEWNKVILLNPLDPQSAYEF